MRFKYTTIDPSQDEFDISFYRSKLEFEINPKGSEHVS